MDESATTTTPLTAAPVNADRYEALLDVVRNRMTNRAFAPCEIS